MFAGNQPGLCHHCPVKLTIVHIDPAPPTRSTPGVDFGWTDAEGELYERARKFGGAVGGAKDGAFTFSRENWKRCGDFGLLGLSIPAAHGGMGLSAQTTARVLEGFSRGCDDTGLAFSVAAHLFACLMPIEAFATDAVKARLVRPLATGAAIGANAITEAEAGSDVFAQKTRAVRDADEYVLTGNKVFVTNGPEADVFLVYASTNPAHGYLGITAFVIERSAPGLTVGKRFETIGLQGAPIGAIYLEDCRVPVENMLGSEGGGGVVFQHSMAWERACLFATYLGVMERQLEQAMKFASERRQFGKPIARNQAVSHRIVDMKLRSEAARLLLYKACWMLDSGEDPTLAAALAKLAVSEAAIESGMDAIRIHGGAGVMVEAGVERGLRDAIPSVVFSGTSEMQRELIAKALGL